MENIELYVNLHIMKFKHAMKSIFILKSIEWTNKRTSEWMNKMCAFTHRSRLDNMMFVNAPAYTYMPLMMEFAQIK